MILTKIRSELLYFLLKLCLLYNKLSADGVHPVNVRASSLAVVKILFSFCFIDIRTLLHIRITEFKWFKWSTPLLENLITHRARRRPCHHWRQWTRSHWRWWAGHQGRPTCLTPAWPLYNEILSRFFCVCLLVVGAWHPNQQLLQDEVKVFWSWWWQIWNDCQRNPQWPI